VIAVDTNILIHAFRSDSPQHSAAQAVVNDRLVHRRRTAIPWPCVHEFLAVVTNRRVFVEPSPTAEAMGVVTELASLDVVDFLAESDQHLATLGGLLAAPGVIGAKVHDARIAAICLDHGVDELWTADRDFSYFPALHTRNPLV
jgi:toxin-antitoxin system PIN domain toxin